MLKHATPPRLFANILQVAPKIFVGFFCIFLTKGRESERYQIGKKILWNTSSSKILLFVFSREFLKNLLARLLSQLFLPQTLWFFFQDGGVWWCEFFFFLFAQRLLETRLFLFSPKRGKTIRRWHWEPQLLAHRVAFLRKFGLLHLVSHQDGLRGHWS